MFPDLPVSRFLMALNDYDIPYIDCAHSLSPSQMNGVAFVGVLLLTAVFALPPSVQDALLQLFINTVLNTTTVFMFTLGKYNATTSIVLSLAIVAVVMIGGYYYDLPRKKRNEIFDKGNPLFNFINVVFFQNEAKDAKSAQGSVLSKSLMRSNGWTRSMSSYLVEEEEEEDIG